MKIALNSVTVSILGAVILSGCAHNDRSTVAMKVDNSEAHVQLGSNEVKAGDRIALFENQCKRPAPQDAQTPHGLDPFCGKFKTGEGTITKVLNDSYSIAKMDPGSKFKEGSTVEKE